jgi:hypothetical protein
MIADTVAGAAAAAMIPTALFAQSAQAPTAIDQFARLQGELRRTHESGDTAAYLAASQTMYSFLNGSPRAILQLMSAQTFAGKPDEALHSFGQFVAMGQADEQVLNGKSFDPLRGLPRYQSISADMGANAAGKSAADEVFRLESTAPIPEDIDYAHPGLCARHWCARPEHKTGRLDSHGRQTCPKRHRRSLPARQRANRDPERYIA